MRLAVRFIPTDGGYDKAGFKRDAVFYTDALSL
jgi:hypothetical protein